MAEALANSIVRAAESIHRKDSQYQIAVIYKRKKASANGCSFVVRSADEEVVSLNSFVHCINFLLAKGYQWLPKEDENRILNYIERANLAGNGIVVMRKSIEEKE